MFGYECLKLKLLFLSNQGQLITLSRKLVKKCRLLTLPGDSMNHSLELGEIRGWGAYMGKRVITNENGFSGRKPHAHDPA